MQQVDASAFYDQDTEVELLTKLLGRLGNKTVMDVGAEKGTFVKALVQAGAEAVYAFEPFPASVEKLRADFGDMPAVHIFDVALGARDETVQLHLVQDKTGEHEDAFHSLVAFDETPTLRTVGEIPVQCRTLQSLLDERAIPKDIGILKVDTERGDFEVLKGLGDVVGDVVMIEYWDNLPETIGAPAYRVAEVATFMAERGYANFLVIKRHDQFEVLQLNSTDTRPGDWGNVMFIHDRVFGQVAPLIYQAVERAQIRLLDRAKFFADEANERLTSVERLTRESDERLAVMAAMQSEAEKRLTLMDEMQEAAARERGRTVLTRLETILEQEAALDAYLQTRHDEGLWQWVTPQIGVLYQHPPMPFQIPEHYLRVPFLPKPPVISIVTPTLNSAQFLPHTINSVLDQEYPALEYIIQDGDSTDETSSILEQYRPRLKHAASEKDNGMAQAINRGFAHATGDVMAYLNSDDMLLPGTLNFVAAYFEENPRVDVVYGHRVLIDAFNAEIGRWVLPSHDDAMLTWADFVPQETLFWRRSIWEKAGGQMDESFKFALDWDLLLRFREAGAVMTRLPRFLAAFRVHPGQKTAVELNEVGLGEMNRLRERQLGRLISDEEVWRYLEGFMRRHKVYHKLYRLGVLRY